jgi:hypothetical protein
MQTESQIVRRVTAKFAMHQAPRMKPRAKTALRKSFFGDQARQCAIPICGMPCIVRCRPEVPHK